MSRAQKHKRAFFRRMVMVAACREVECSKPCGHTIDVCGCRDCQRAFMVKNGLWQKCLAAEPRGYDEFAHFRAMHHYGRVAYGAMNRHGVLAAVAAGVPHAG
jgi:hypothetical protein